jgi:ankyrin repeat protein
MPLCVAAQLDNLNVLRILINELGADANQAVAGSNNPKRNGITPLCVAAQLGHVAVLRCLVKEYGADVNQADNEGWTPIHIGAEKGYVSVMQCLVKELGANMNQATNEGCTPLYAAAQCGHLSVVHCIVKELGADVNQATHTGSTPLITASAYKHIQVVVWLSKHGADAQASHRGGSTAADVSREYGAPAEQSEYLEARAKCANPGCDGAGLKKCAGCLKVFFCDPACIRAHWPAHKAECKRIAESSKVKEGKGKWLFYICLMPIRVLAFVYM